MTDLLASALASLRSAAAELRLDLAEKRNALESAQTAVAIAQARYEQAQRAVEIMEKAAAEPAAEPKEPRAKPGEVQRAVLGVLGEGHPAKGMLSADDLAAETGYKADSIKAVLQRCVKSGVLERIGERYRIRVETHEAAE